MLPPALTLTTGHWLPAQDGDPRARALYLRHYSALKRAGRPKSLKSVAFVGPGEKMVLLTQQCDALFVWRKCLYRMDSQRGVECYVFRNEGTVRASDLILEAEQLAWGKWPEERLFTFVDPSCVASDVPGYCFIRAKWRRLSEPTKGGLRVLEKQP